MTDADDAGPHDRPPPAGTPSAEGDPTVAAGLPRIPGVRLTEEIGRGGFATVFRGHQLSVNRDVAVKIDDRRLVDARDQRRFTREIIAAGTVAAHPHIVTLYDGGTTADDHPYLVMELYPGGSYSDKMRTQGPIPVAEVLEVGFAIADALVAAHGEGILHRDVKPGNILISKYGSPALTDFGLAALPPAGEGYSVTMDSLTPSYAAPEAFGGVEPTVGMDIYALGATLYAMLIGRSPRSDASGANPPIARLLTLLNQPLPDPGIPGSGPLMQVIWRATAVEPHDRYQTAAALRDALAEARSGGRSSTGPVAPVVPTQPPGDTTRENTGGRAPFRPDADPSNSQPLLPGTGDDHHSASRGRALLVALTALVVVVLAGGAVVLVALRGPVTGQPMIDPGATPPVVSSSTPSTTPTTSTVTTSPTTTPPSTTTPTTTTPTTPSTTTPTTTTPSTTRTTIDPLPVGTCFGAVTAVDGQVTAQKVDSCDLPHAWETYATGVLDPATTSPALTDIVNDPVYKKTCTKEALQDYLGPDRSGQFKVRVIPPTQAAFQAGHRTFYCVAAGEDGGVVTGSLRQTG